MAGAVREPPRAFEAKLRAMWPDFRRIEYDTTYDRWRFFFTSAAGRECSVLYCWDRNPITGGPPDVDPVSGLRPFRDLDADAQREIIYHGERTALTNPLDGPGTWEKHTKQHLDEQAAIHRKRREKNAEDYAYALQQVDLRRPWLKEHQRAKKGTGMKIGRGGAVNTPTPRFHERANGIQVLASFGKGRKSISTGVIA